MCGGRTSLDCMARFGGAVSGGRGQGWGLSSPGCVAEDVWGPAACDLCLSSEPLWLGGAGRGWKMEGVLLDTINLICLLKKKKKRQREKQHVSAKDDFGP